VGEVVVNSDKLEHVDGGDLASSNASGCLLAFEGLLQLWEPSEAAAVFPSGGLLTPVPDMVLFEFDG